MEAPIDTVKDAVTARTLLVHLKENRIEYLLVIVVGHLLGVSDRILAQASGICFQNLYTNLYVYKSPSSDMARLYWRVKKEGKWTWKPVKEHCEQCDNNICIMDGVLCATQERIKWLQEEEE